MLGGLSGDEREEPARLRGENAKLRMEREILPKSSCLLREEGRRAVGEVYSLIAAEKTDLPVAVMCRVLGVSRAGPHIWERRAPSDRALADAWVTEKIRQIHEQSRGVSGAPRIHAELQLEHDQLRLSPLGGLRTIARTTRINNNNNRPRCHVNRVRSTAAAASGGRLDRRFPSAAMAASGSLGVPLVDLIAAGTSPAYICAGTYPLRRA
jgi:hypothetical protein